jgi:K+-sensing histidine kinase KdpD
MPRILQPYTISIVSVVAVTIARWLLDPVLEDLHIFSVYYAAVAVSAWCGGLRPALAALVVGWIAAQLFFLEPRRPLSLVDPDGLAGSLTYAAIGLAILACTEGIRRASRGTVRITPEACELRAVADAVRMHRINSRDLVAYLEGLNASPETFIAAAQYEDFDLPPDELAARLDALAEAGRASQITSV